MRDETVILSKRINDKDYFLSTNKTYHMDYSRYGENIDGNSATDGRACRTTEGHGRSKGS